MNRGESMKIIIIVVVILMVIIAAVLNKIARKMPGTTPAKVSAEKVKPEYKYKAKKFLMTRNEREVYKNLEKITKNKYYIFPQIHISEIIDHKIEGQNWKAALSKIQRKSVDYVLCDKETLGIVYVVELDDRTHEREDRVERDIEVEKIFTNAGVKLVRIKREMSEREMISAFISVK
jgi:hypothetical protein